MKNKLIIAVSDNSPTKKELIPIGRFYSDIKHADNVLTKMKLVYLNEDKVTTVYAEKVQLMSGTPYYCGKENGITTLKNGDLIRFFEFRKNDLDSYSILVDRAPYGKDVEKNSRYYIELGSIEQAF